jgi:hypothetical protein
VIAELARRSRELTDETRAVEAATLAARQRLRTAATFRRSIEAAVALYRPEVVASWRAMEKRCQKVEDARREAERAWDGLATARDRLRAEEESVAVQEANLRELCGRLGSNGPEEVCRTFFSLWGREGIA